jgi:ankyrin repeat protein
MKKTGLRFAIFASIVWLLMSPVSISRANVQQKDKNMDLKGAFIEAITKGDIAKINDLLKTDPSLNKTTDKNGVSVILLATYYSRKDIVEALLKTGMDLDIFEASATGQTDRVKELLKQNHNLVNQFAPDGFYPIGLATFFGHKDIVELLIANGADVRTAARNAMKVTSLHAAAAGKWIEIAKILLERGADPNARQMSGYVPLHEIAGQGSVEFAKLLLDHGADINAKSDDGKTALAMAIELKRSDMEAFLRSQGATQ